MNCTSTKLFCGAQRKKLRNYGFYLQKMICTHESKTGWKDRAVMLYSAQFFSLHHCVIHRRITPFQCGLRRQELVAKEGTCNYAYEKSRSLLRRTRSCSDWTYSLYMVLGSRCISSASFRECDGRAF